MRGFILNILVIFLIISGGFVNAQQPGAVPVPAAQQPAAQQPAVPVPTAQPQVVTPSQPSTPQTVPTAQQPTLQQPTAQPQVVTPSQPATPQTVQPQLTPQQVETLKGLSPEQQKAIQTELGKTGGVLTPEALEAIKTRPEFKGLTTEEIVKGKEILEKKGIEVKEEVEKKPFEIVPEKKMIGAEEDKTLFERFRTTGEYQDISMFIRPFGYNFFQEAAVRVLTDRKDIPVPSRYIIGPGDEVKLLFWGRVNAQYNLTVDRNGNITIPQMGPIQVAGMAFEDMSKHLIKQSEQIVGANVDITMGSLKTIPIFVLGDVRRPGAYTVGSFATITDALLIAGGPTGIGSMRDIQLKRKDKVVKTFDLYDLLLKGDKSNDKILDAGDVVFVPVAGSLVGIAGNVKRPAIYELKGRYDLQNLFDLAGGIIPTAYTQQIQVERIIKNEKQVVVDIDDKHLLKAKDFLLQDADLVKVFNIVEKETNVFFVSGNVKRPGKYEYKPGMRISNVIKDSTDLLAETQYDYALIKRLVPPDLKPELIPFNLGKLIFDKDEASNIELRPQDIIYVFSKWFFKERPFVTVEGEVRKGGKFSLFGNFRVKDAILAAGDLSKEAYVEKAEIIRINDKREYQVIYFNVGKAMAGDPGHNIMLNDEDRIIIHSIRGYVYKRTVSVDGVVLKPGAYPYIENMTVKDLIFAAGNILESTYLEDADVSFHVVESGKDVRIEHKRINLKKAIEGDSEHNLVLQPYSRLFVKQIPRWRDEEFVSVTGEARFPGKYIIKRGETLSSLLERCGGYTEKAYLRGVVFTRVRVKELQQKTLDEMIARLEKDLVAQSSLKLSTAVSQEEVAGLQAQQQGAQRLLDALKKTPATGRVTIKLAHLRLLKGSEYDLELEDGDTLHIPTKNNVVNVAGAVMAQGSHLYSEGLTYDDYIERAGGFSRYADSKNIFLLKVDGSAARMSRGFISWSPKRSRWELNAFGDEVKDLEPGDTIVIPEKIEATAWMRGLKDITQILSNVGIFVSAIHYLFNQ